MSEAEKHLWWNPQNYRKFKSSLMGSLNGSSSRLRSILFVLMLGVSFSACTITAPEYFPVNPTPAPPEPKPPEPSPTPKKDDEPDQFLCKVINGEGRTFKGIGEDASEARRAAHRACAQVSRNCVYLSCTQLEKE